MKQQTIKEVLSEVGGIQEADYRLYLMRDDETVFYVGQSRNPHNRFLSHLGMDRRSSMAYDSLYDERRNLCCYSSEGLPPETPEAAFPPVPSFPLV